MNDEVRLDPRLELAQEGDPDELVEVVVRLRRPGLAPPGLEVVGDLGEIVTGRVLRREIARVHDHEDVESMKTGELVVPEPDAMPDGDEVGAEAAEADERRPRRDPATGRGSIVAVVDWWFDLAHAAFRTSEGRSRVAAFWDQRDVQGPGVRPTRYGYGRVLERDVIDRALAETDAYAALNYRPWDGDPAGEGTHGTHVASIAAGSAHVSPAGVAPGAELLLVHLVDRSRTEGTSLGSSVSLLEAIDWIVRTAGARPFVISLSMGRHGDAHLGRSLVERALDAVVTAGPGRFCAQSTGNYYSERVHSLVTLDAGTRRSVTWEIPAGDPTPNELEVWYPAADAIALELRAPDGRKVEVGPGERGAIGAKGNEIARVVHRRNDPNANANNAVCFLDRAAPTGAWTVTLTGLDIVDGRCHLWVERDVRAGQSRFAEADAVTTTTTGSIANGMHTVAVGGYDAADSDRPIGRFSSVGPTVDGRRKPFLVAPGVRVLAARSAKAGSKRGDAATTRKSGSSMAAPHVAGLVALLQEASNRPLPAREVRRLLVQSVDRPAASVADRARYGAGYLNMDRALELTRRWAGSEQVEVPLAMPALSREGAGAVTAEVGATELSSLAGETPATALSERSETEGERGVEDDKSRGGFLRDVVRLRSAALAPARALPAPEGGMGRALARTYNRVGGLIDALAGELGLEPAAVLAVWLVEGGGREFTPGRPVLRVENHLLFRAWGNRDPATFDTYFQFGTRPPLDASLRICGNQPCDAPWRCHRSRQAPTAEFSCDHTSQAREYDVLALASRLAGEETALRCSSIGGPQILGSHHARLGYASAREMREAFGSDERYEVIGFFDFCRADPRLLAALRQLHWADFARIYNGPGKVAEYARRVENAYAEARALLGAPQRTPADERWQLAPEANGAPAVEAPAVETPATQAPAAGAATPRAPVHPLILALRDPGQLAFDILAGRPREYADELLSDEFEILGLPGGRLAEALRPGDLIVSWADGAPGESSLAVVASPLSLAPDETEAFGAGEYVETIDPTDWNGGRPQRVRVLTAEGTVPADCIALRVRPIPGEVPGASALVAPSGEVAIESAVDDRLAAVAGCTLDPYRYDSTGEACADGPAVGTRALKRLLLERFGTRRAGIYNCRNVRGGRSLSLHAEGRAIDYYLDAHNAAERAVGDGLVSWLLQPDAAGNPHAHARRLGVQEVIWNRQIWSAGRRRDQGLRPYGGPSPHEDHVHIGQHRLGATMRTSYWAGC